MTSATLVKYDKIV